MLGHRLAGSDLVDRHITVLPFDPMPPLPRVTGRKVVQALRQLGWEVVVQKGSHVQLKHPEAGWSSNSSCPRLRDDRSGLLRSILAKPSSAP